VQKLWKKFRETGSVADKAGRGRNRATVRDDSRIVEKLKRIHLTIRAIQENLKLNVSHKTIRRRLYEVNLHSKLAKRRPFINK